MHIRHNLAAKIANFMIERNIWYQSDTGILGGLRRDDGYYQPAMRYPACIPPIQYKSGTRPGMSVPFPPNTSGTAICHQTGAFCRIPMFYIRACPSLGMDSTHRDPVILYAAATVILGMLILSAGCTVPVSSPAPPVNASPEVVPDNGQAWKDIPLTDLQGKGNFSIASFAGKPVILPVVSDSCPPCVLLLSRQLREIDLLPGVQNGTIIVVALDLDPPLGPGFIVNYHDQFNFTGYSARSSPEMTNRLFDMYGIFAVETDAVPVILLCPDGRALLLPSGVKSAENLTTTIGQEC